MDEVDPESVGLVSRALTQLDATLLDMVTAGRRAGLVYAIAKEGQLIRHRAIGQRDIANSLPMEEDSLFRLYSMTRAVTAVAVLMLHEAGYFALDDPVARFIPAFADTPVLEQGSATTTEALAAPLTIYQLLTYTSGLGYPHDYDPSLGVTFEQIIAPGLTIEDGMNYLATRPLLFQPGARWHYGLSGEVLGRLVEVVSGQRFDIFLRDTIFRPLGLSHLAFQVPEADWHRLATVYAPDAQRELADATDRAPVLGSYRQGDIAFSGGGGLVGTALDYLRFTQMLLAGGELDGARILKPDTIRLMTRNHLTSAQGPLVRYVQDIHTSPEAARRFDGYGWGLGVAVRLVDEPHTVPGGRGEFGWYGLANTFYFADPENRIAAVALAQYFGSDAADIETALRDALYAQPGGSTAD